MNDCWWAVQYILKNPGRFNIDLARMVFGGDSAGGNAAVVITQRLIKGNMIKPKLQVLIYPWLQMITLQFPSYVKYHDPMLASLSLDNLVLWYLGFERLTAEMNDVFYTNDHLLLLDESERTRIASLFNVSLINEKFTVSSSYHEDDSTKWSADPLRTRRDVLDESHILVRDTEFAERIKHVFTDDVSPLLTDSSILSQYPATYLVVSRTSLYYLEF